MDPKRFMVSSPFLYHLTFTLQVLEDSIDNKIDKCRSIQDLLSFVTYSLSQGVRWIPEQAKALAVKDLDARNTEGKRLLQEALGDKTVEQFVASQAERIRGDLNRMYQMLGQVGDVPAGSVERVLKDVRGRLTRALSGALTPSAVHNRIAAVDLTRAASDENWRQPLALLEAAARRFRECHPDPFFGRRFSGVCFNEEALFQACDVFGDVGVLLGRQAAASELGDIDEIVGGAEQARDKCHKLWNLIRDQPNLSRSVQQPTD